MKTTQRAIVRSRDSKKPFKGNIGSTKPQDPDLQPPIFSFEKMQEGSGYSVTCCQRDDQAALSKCIFKLSKVTWRDIRHSPRHGIGTETIHRASLKVGLPHGIPDDATLIAIRFNGMKPMIGYRDARVFYVVFLDSNFSAYNH